MKLRCFNPSCQVLKQSSVVDQMFDNCMIAVKPVIHAVLMSIIFHHYKHLSNFVDELKNKDAEKLASHKSFTLNRWTDKTFPVQWSDNKTSH